MTYFIPDNDMCHINEDDPIPQVSNDHSLESPLSCQNHIPAIGNSPKNRQLHIPQICLGFISEVVRVRFE